MNRQIHTMPGAATAPDFNQLPYVGLDFSPKLTLYFILLADNIAELGDLFLGKVLNFNIRLNSGSGQNPLA